MLSRDLHRPARSSPGSSRSSSCSPALGSHPHAAGRAVSRHRAAPGQHPRQLSRRLGRDAGEQRHPGDRAAAHRHRRPALFPAPTRARAARSTITVTFDKGVNPDIAQVQVQNKVQQALPPAAAAGAAAGHHGHQVQPGLPDGRRGLRRHRPADERRRLRLSRLATCRIRSAASPASATSTCSARSTRCASGSIPYKLASYQLMPSDVIAAIQAQNTQVAAGQIGGQPPPEPDAERHGHRPVAADRRPTSSATSSSRPSPTARSSVLSGRRARRARQRELPARQPRSTAIPAPASRSARARRRRAEDRRPGQARRSSEHAEAFPPGYRATPSRTTPPPSSSCRSTRW